MCRGGEDDTAGVPKEEASEGGGQSTGGRKVKERWVGVRHLLYRIGRKLRKFRKELL